MNTGLSSEILFEKFEIIEVLKKDEHAAVFLANHIYLSKRIILKVLNTQKISDHSMVERFKREAKILAKLDHPHIIKVLDFGTFKEYFYISFEYIDGLSLRNLLKQSQLTFEQKQQLMIQLLKGLHHAHQFNIIHRDIKPENIFIDNNLTLKIGDFGLALSAEDNLVTNPYSIVGTPSYMSPEQVRGAKLTAQSDLFSAGVVIFELFTGKNPFLKDNVSLTLNEIMAYDEGIVSKGSEDLPQEIKSILFRLLRKNPKDRYTSALEVLNELKVPIDQPTIVIKNGELNNGSKNLKYIWTVLTLVVAVLVVIWLFKYSFHENVIQENSPAEVKKDNSSINKDSIENTNVLDQENSKADSNKTNTNEEIGGQQGAGQKPNNNDSNNTAGIGYLTILCNQSARIYIDDVDYDVTPIRLPFKLQAAEYNIKLYNQDYPPYTATVTIKANQYDTLKVDLNATVGFIRCTIYPFGNIIVDNTDRGELDIRPKLFKVKPNKGIRVIAKNSYYKTIDTTVTVAKGDTLKMDFRLKKQL